MKILLAIIGAIGGGVAGFFVAFLGIYPILVSIEGRDMNGGIAMGVATVIAPICVVAGAVLGLLAVLRLARNKSPTPPVDFADLENEAAADEALLSPPAGKRPSMFDTQALIAIAIVAVAVFAAWQWLFATNEPAHFSVHGPKPVMEFELKVPTAEILEDDYFRIRAELRSWEHQISARYPLKRTDMKDGTTLLSGSVALVNKTTDRTLHLWLSTARLHEFVLPYAVVPEAEAEFSQWRRVTRIDHRTKAWTDTEPKEDIFIRTRMTWPGS